MSREQTPNNNSVIRPAAASTPHSASMYLTEQAFDALADAWQAGYDAATRFIDGKTGMPENPYKAQTLNTKVSEQMSHKDEAARLDKLSSIQPDADSANSFALSGLLHATLALVEAQEAANELKRIETRFVLAKFAADNDLPADLWGDQVVEALVNLETLQLQPAIAAALGIGAAQ